MWGALEVQIRGSRSVEMVGEGRVRPAVEGKPLKLAESLICQA